MEIAQDPDAGAVLVDDAGEQGERVALARVGLGGEGGVRQAGGGAPQVEGLALRGGEGFDFGERARFFGRDDPEHGVAGAYVGVELLLHGGSGPMPWLRADGCGWAWVSVPLGVGGCTLGGALAPLSSPSNVAFM